MAEARDPRDWRSYLSMRKGRFEMAVAAVGRGTTSVGRTRDQGRQSPGGGQGGKNFLQHPSIYRAVDPQAEHSASLSFFLKIVWLHHSACRTLVPWTGIEPVSPALEVQCLNYWAARDIPTCIIS